MEENDKEVEVLVRGKDSIEGNNDDNEDEKQIESDLEDVDFVVRLKGKSSSMT